MDDGTGWTLYPDGYTQGYIEAWVKTQLVTEIEEEVDLEFIQAKGMLKYEDSLIMEEWYEEHEMSLEEMAACEEELMKELCGVEYHEWEEAWLLNRYEGMGIEKGIRMEEEVKEGIEGNEGYVSFLGLREEWLEEEEELYEDAMYEELYEDPM